MMVSLCLSKPITKPSNYKIFSKTKIGICRNSQRLQQSITKDKSLPKSRFEDFKEIPSCICQDKIKASFTLEAAVVLPLIAGFIVSLLFFFRVMQIETEVAEALNYAGRMTAVECSAMDNSSLSLASSELLFRKEFNQYSLPEDYLLGGKEGVSLIASKFTDEYVKLRVIYRVKLPISFFNMTGVTISQGTCHRKWIGDRLDSDDEDVYVFYTDTGKVYHSTKSCPYLDLSIHSVEMAEIKASRNKSGHKYSPCSKCVAKKNGGKSVYITDYGVLYHLDLQCSRLKRTIHAVKLSEVGERGGCSKCVKSK